LELRLTIPNVTILVKCYTKRMRRVNIAGLKAQLSAYLQRVQEGEEVLVCDRKKPVARIVPVEIEDHSEQERNLVARGVLTPPRVRQSDPIDWPDPPGNVPDEVMEQIWREERESR
jgi:prevent-host-death family protein